MKKLAVVAFAVAFALCLAACGSSASKSASGDSASSAASSSVSSSSASSESVSSSSAAKDFDGSAFEETGAGNMYLSSPGGTTENGNVPKFVAKSPQIGINYFDGDGSVCVVYVDGVETDKINAGNMQATLNLKSDAVTPGVHTVEVVCMDGDAPKIYKKAQYEIVV